VLPGRAPSQGGAKVNYEMPSFPIYNQRTDVELSTGGSSYDVLNVTFIYIDFIYIDRFSCNTKAGSGARSRPAEPWSCCRSSF
jgi:hypothetical protein